MNNWISTKDSLPLPGKRVWTCDVNGVIAEGVMDDNQMWQTMVWDNHIRNVSVDYWMLLPAPPEVPHG